MCLDFRFSCEIPHDVRKEKGEYSVVEHKPVSIITEWNPLVVQCLSAAWSNEVLDEVSLDFARFDSSGQEVTFATMTLSKATVAVMDLGSGDTSRFVQGEYLGLAQIGLSPEKIEFKVKDKGGDASAHYDRKMAGS
jgi:type VI protein secretion system component Hcp